MPQAEGPGSWSGHQAAELGVSAVVDADELQRLLEGRHPVTGGSIGAPLRDRQTAVGRVVKAVAGFDAIKRSHSLRDVGESGRTPVDGR